MLLPTHKQEASSSHPSVTFTAVAAHIFTGHLYKSEDERQAFTFIAVLAKVQRGIVIKSFVLTQRKQNKEKGLATCFPDESIRPQTWLVLRSLS